MGGWIGVNLPVKLLLMTAVFVMLAEILIFVPSVANYRRNWLMERVVAGKIASLALEASDGADLPQRLRQELLMTAGVHAVSLKRPNFRKLVLGMTEDHPIAAIYDLRSVNFLELNRDGLQSFLTPPGRYVRVVGAPDMMPDDEIDIVIDETPLRAAMWGFAKNIFWVSLLISLTTAALVYFALSKLLVDPMMGLTRSMVHYREDPEDTSRIIVPSGRRDEIGVAEQELAALQTELSGFLREKARLANIGLAVSKINHDLRNMLASAQLVSDRLATVADPTVQRFVPRLIRALDRAIGLCVDTLKYGRSEEPPPKKTRFPLRPLATEVAESLGVEELENARVGLSIPHEIEIWADRDQIFRVIGNLVSNALQAARAQEAPPSPLLIQIGALEEGDFTLIWVADNGPGIPNEVRPNLFKAFQTSSRVNGTGLGLVICAELIRAHGGNISLDDSASGAYFSIRLPRAPLNQGRRDAAA